MTTKQIRLIVQNKTVSNLSKKTRKRDYINARLIYYRLAREFTTLSLAKIGREVGVNHASVLHALKSFDFTHDEYVNKIYKYCKIELIEILKNTKPEEATEHSKDVTIKGLSEQVKELKTEETLKINKLLKNIKRSDLKQLLSLDDETINFFCDTRLKPFLKMLETHVTNKDLILHQHQTRKM